jgi:oxygen-independent coproporphyrinogen-3 oxidase
MTSNSGEEIVSLFSGSDPSLSVYVHIPFCAGKCPYCSFFSVVPRRGEKEEYCSLLRTEMRFFGERLADEGKFVRTLYFGGGTPSLLSPDEWERLFDCFYHTFSFSERPEITIEANPESLTEGHLSVWKKHGVSRISIGVQSLSDDELLWLGRIHDADAARRALEQSVLSGFSVSADLMFGLGEQTLRSFKRSVTGVLDLGADHISLYQLALEEKCRWFAIPPEDRSDGYPFYRWSQWYLPGKGFFQYEISSFSRPEKECRHNFAYWTNGQVLALGPGAWGYAGGIRYCNERTLPGYFRAVRHSGNAVAEMEKMEEERRVREAAVLLLRTSKGIVFEDFASRYGHGNLLAVVGILEEGVPPACLSWSSVSVALSPAGMRVANAIWSLLVV